MLDKIKSLFRLIRNLLFKDECNLENVCNEITNFMPEYKVNVDKYRFSENFYDKRKNIYDSSDYWFEDLYVDYKKWFLNDIGTEPYNDIGLEELSFCFDEDEIHSLIDGYYEYIEEDETIKNVDNNELLHISELRLSDIEEDFPHLHNKILNYIATKVKLEYDLYDLEEMDVLDLFYNIRDFRGRFDAIEALSYWTVYFDPKWFDEDLAWDVGLFPFEFKGEKLLALWGCGMDLSPKLDAYQALNVGTIPKDSQFIRQPSYAKYVVGEEVFNRVMDKIILEKPTLKLVA